jgi:hypothetical protein
MSPWLIALVILAGFMLVRGIVMLYLAVQVRRMHRLLERY